jgi:hypothetical protein
VRNHRDVHGPVGSIDGVNLESERSATDRSLPAAQQASEVAKHDQLQKLLASPQTARAAQQGTFLDRLQKATYLVSDKLTEPKFWEQVRVYQAFVVPAVALMVIVGVIGGAAWSSVSPPAAPPRPPLSASFVAGEVREAPKGPQVEVGAPMKSGTEVAIGPRSSLRLITRSGNTIKLGAQASLKIERLAGTNPDLVLVLSRVYCAFDLRKAGEFEIRYGKYTIRPEAAVFTMEEEEGAKYTLIVDAGKVVVEERDAPSTSLDPGDAKVLQ